MSMQISAPRQVSVPARKIVSNAQPSALTVAMGNLQIGEGLDYVASGSDKAGNPAKATLKNQYGNVAPKKWAAQGKTFKMFVAEDQEGLGEFETRFTVARVEFEEPKVRKSRKVAAAADNGADHGEGADNGEYADNGEGDE